MALFRVAYLEWAHADSRLWLARTTPSLSLQPTSGPFPPSSPSVELHSSQAHIYLLLKVKSIFSTRLYKISKLVFYKIVVRLTAARLTETLFIALQRGRSWLIGLKSPAVDPQSLPPILLLAVNSVLFTVHCAMGTATLNICRPASVKSWPPLKLCGEGRQQTANCSPE